MEVAILPLNLYYSFYSHIEIANCPRCLGGFLNLTQVNNGAYCVTCRDCGAIGSMENSMADALAQWNDAGSVI